MKHLKSRILASMMAVLLSLSALSAVAFAAEPAAITENENSIATLQAAELPDYTAQWPSYRGNTDNIGLTDAKTPRTAEEAATKFELRLKSNTDYNTAISDPIMVNSDIYIAVGNELFKIDTDGNILGKGTLAGNIGYTCRLLYLDGVVVVPFTDASVEAINADTLESVWTLDAPAPGVVDGQEWSHQALSTLTGDNGCIYMGTACADWVSSYYGVYRCIDAVSGEVIWEYTNENAGYYWSGGAILDNAILFAGDDGILVSLDKQTGEEIDQMDLGAPVRSTTARVGNEIYLTSNDGTLHQIEVLDGGKLGSSHSIKFADYSTSTPAVYNGVAYVGGQTGTSYPDYKGVLCAIDLSTMQIINKVSAPADIKSAPLISYGHTGEVYAYFTSNTTPGGIYTMKLSGDASEAQSIFVPSKDAQNYCMTSIMAGEDGTLYYTNDSGVLFAVSYNGPTDDTSSDSSDSSDQSDASNITSDTSSAISQDDSSASQNQSESDTVSSSHQNAVNNAQTGDQSISWIIFVVILAAAIVVVIVLLVLGRKRK